MFSPKVLIFPDSGPEFLRALRTAVFYSDQVLQAIPPLAPTKEVLDRIRGEAMAIKVDRSWRRPFAAVNFQLEAYNEIAMLVAEKIIVPPNYSVISTFTGEG